MAVGVLFWVSNLVTLIGSVISGPIPSTAGGVAAMQAHSTAFVVGTLVAHVNDAAIIGYAVLLYPVLKRYGEGPALGYVAFKTVEAVMLLVAAATLLSLLAPGTGDPVSFKGPIAVTLGQAFWANRLGALAYIVATPILNYLLYRSQLVPRFITVLGFAGVVLLATGLAIGVGDPTRGFQAGQLLVIPIILWELVFATWLIVRGFNQAAPA